VIGELFASPVLEGMAMSKQWFFQVMGEELGPVSSVELKEKVKQGQIQPETLVRLGREGRWTPADRVKGLLDPPPVPAPAPPLPPRPDARPPASRSQAPAPAPVPVAANVTNSPHVERTYHLQGETDTHVDDAVDGAEQTEYDFFQFVGFELALGTPLHQKLLQHCGAKRQTITQVTRLALADYLGCPELVNPPITDRSPPEDTNSTPPTERGA